MATYDEVVLALMELCEIPMNMTDIDFQNILPSTFDYASNRMYRELDLLATNITTNGSAFTAGNGRLAVPAALINITYVSLLSPGATSGDTSTRTPLVRVSREFLDLTWPTGTTTSGTAVPAQYAVYGDASGFTSTGAFTIRVAPAPSTAYVAEFTGPVRPTVLSEDNPTTILTVRYPDMFIACCMINLMAYQRDWGAKSSDPQASQSWEAQYNALREGAIVESARQRSESTGWSTYTPSILANKPRATAGGGTS